MGLGKAVDPGVRLAERGYCQYLEEKKQNVQHSSGGEEFKLPDRALVFRDEPVLLNSGT